MSCPRCQLLEANVAVLKDWLDRSAIDLECGVAPDRVAIAIRKALEMFEHAQRNRGHGVTISHKVKLTPILIKGNKDVKTE